MAPSPKNVTTYGRLSFPAFTAQEGFDLSQRGKYPAKSVADAQPNFNLILEQHQLDKVRDHVLNTFLPYCGQQFAANEKKDAIDPKDLKALVKQVEDSEWDGALNTPFKPVPEKTQLLAPEGVVVLKAIGNKGVDTDLLAIVNDENELAVPDPDLLKFPVVRPIGQTVHKMYGGCYVAATLNLYAYYNGKHPGFSAGASTAVFRADGDRFGGGMAVDENAIFLD